MRKKIHSTQSKKLGQERVLHSFDSFTGTQFVSGTQIVAWDTNCGLGHNLGHKLCPVPLGLGSI